MNSSNKTVSEIAYQIGFNDPSYNELDYARRVANQLGVKHTFEVIEPQVADLFDHLMTFMDDPIGDFSIFPTYLVSRRARQQGTGALRGDGGDELFAGYAWHAKAARIEALARRLGPLGPPLAGMSRLLPPCTKDAGQP